MTFKEMFATQPTPTIGDKTSARRATSAELQMLMLETQRRKGVTLTKDQQTWLRDRKQKFYRNV